MNNNTQEQASSVFAEFAWKYIERGISVVPIAPSSKKPGQYSIEKGWRGMGDWTRFAERVPTELELEHWEQWPDAGIGVVLGKCSGIVALDKDYDLPGNGNDALQALIPYSPVAKKGEKGWTRFYRYNGERSCSFDVNGARVLDVLSDGRQTVVPPTMHPSGLHYTWITEDTLDCLHSIEELPRLPDDFLQQVERVLAPYQTEQDKKHQRKTASPKLDSRAINTDLSIQAEYFLAFLVNMHTNGVRRHLCQRHVSQIAFKLRWCMHMFAPAHHTLRRFCLIHKPGQLAGLC